jgi:preprotein translocase subunit SecE
MALRIYKPRDGYWTRMLSAIGAGILVLGCVGWLWNELQVIQDTRTRGISQTVMALSVVIGLGALIYYLLNKPSIADFMISTEAEMKKVNWPTRRELIGSTWIVIGGTVFMALLLLLIDVVLHDLAVVARVLEGNTFLSSLLQRFTGG